MACRSPTGSRRRSSTIASRRGSSGGWVRGSQNLLLLFKSLKIDWLKDEPADSFLGIMNGGYAKAPDVRCTHCHVADDFASDDLQPKRAAREMATTHHGINQQLGRMENLEGSPQDRFINCATCHRGRVDPHHPSAR
jgi:hypothetical protein